jgi:hypothetical protein
VRDAIGGHLASIITGQRVTRAGAGRVELQNTAQNPSDHLTDALVEGSFGWITGEPLGFTSLGVQASARRRRSRGLRTT